MKKKSSVFESLNDDTLTYIMSFISPSVICKINMLCTTIRRIIHEYTIRYLEHINFLVPPHMNIQKVYAIYACINHGSDTDVFNICRYFKSEIRLLLLYSTRMKRNYALCHNAHFRMNKNTV